MLKQKTEEIPMDGIKPLDSKYLPGQGQKVAQPTKDGQEGISKVGDANLEAFLASVHFDKRLYKRDIQGSVAHVKMLESIGVVDATERET